MCAFISFFFFFFLYLRLTSSLSLSLKLFISRIDEQKQFRVFNHILEICRKHHKRSSSLHYPFGVTHRESTERETEAKGREGKISD